MILDACALWELRRVDEFRGTELARPRLFAGVGVDGDDARRTDEGRRRNDAKTDRTTAEDGDIGAL